MSALVAVSSLVGGMLRTSVCRKYPEAESPETLRDNPAVVVWADTHHI